MKVSTIIVLILFSVLALFILAPYIFSNKKTVPVETYETPKNIETPSRPVPVAPEKGKG